MQKPFKAQVGHGLSRFLITYLAALFGILMLVHVLQRDRDPPGGASHSPAHQDRQGAAKQALTDAGTGGSCGLLAAA